MNKPDKLTKNITEEEFDHGYWYATEIKAFAKELGIANTSKLRKDELESLIKHYIRTGEIKKSERKTISQKGIKDSDFGLTLDLEINNYTNNKETKDFIEREALKMNPSFIRKSGALYRLNRWRDEQVTKGNKITYGNLVKEYVRLNEPEEPFEKIPHGRYINFVAEYLANEKGAERSDALAAWKTLKEQDIPKDYSSWKQEQLKSFK